MKFVRSLRTYFQRLLSWVVVRIFYENRLLRWILNCCRNSYFSAHTEGYEKKDEGFNSFAKRDAINGGQQCLRRQLISAISSLLIVLTFLWATGLSDFFFQIPTTEFRWPPYVDVYREVVRDIIGQPTKSAFLYDWKINFIPKIKPVCPKLHLRRPNKNVLIVVKSAPNRINHRNAIRETWSTIHSVNNYQLRTIFVMGNSLKSEIPFDSLQEMLLEESKQYEDILVGDFADNYWNNTYKFVHSIGYARHFCEIKTTDPSDQSVIPFVLLVDDDYFVQPWNLVAEISKHLQHERLYTGWRFDSSPFRLRFQKYRVSLNEYPFSAFPPYISAGAVLLTSQTVMEFYSAIQWTKLFKFDDIYAAILAHFLGINPVHSERFRFWDDGGSIQNWNSTGMGLIAAHGFPPEKMRQMFARVLKRSPPTPPTTIAQRKK